MRFDYSAARRPPPHVAVDTDGAVIPKWSRARPLLNTLSPAALGCYSYVIVSRVAVSRNTGKLFAPLEFIILAPAIIENSFSICFRFPADKITAEASFTGEEFLKYTFDGNTEGDAFVLHFKTKHPAGLLYHMGKCHARARRKYDAENDGVRPQVCEIFDRVADTEWPTPPNPRPVFLKLARNTK